MKYIVFICRKCGHNLYVDESSGRRDGQPSLMRRLGKIAERDCPNCGEEGYENWILSCLAAKFPGDDE